MYFEMFLADANLPDDVKEKSVGVDYVKLHR